MNHSRKQKGLTFIEVLIGGGLLLAIWGFVAMYLVAGSSQVDIAKEGVLLDTLKSCIKSTKGGPTYAGVTQQTVAKSYCMDSTGSVNSARTQIISSFGGAINISSVTVGGVSNGGAKIVINDLPPEACSALIANKHGAFREITSGAVKVKSLGDTSISPTKLNEGCASSTNNNDVAFVFTT